MEPELARNIDLDCMIGDTQDCFKERVSEIRAEKKKAKCASEIPQAIMQLIAQFVVQSHNYAWVGDAKGEFFKYHNGIWHDEVEVALNRVIRWYLEEASMKPNKSTKEEIKELIKELKQFKKDQFDSDSNIVNYLNGFLFLDDMSFHRYNDTPTDIRECPCTIQIPHNYKSDATAPRFINWLHDTLQGDWKKFDLIIKAIGVTLTSNVKFQRLFMIKGPGNSGKSTLLNIIATIIGRENLSAIPLQRLAKRFGTWGIARKLLNFYADIPTNKAVRDPSRIKVLTDKYLDFEEKIGGFYTIMNTVKHWFSTNRIPPVEGLDLAYARRWIIIEFIRELSEDEIIPDLEKTIIDDPGEMEGIISMAMDAYVELEAAGGFKNVQSPQEVMQLIMEETDSVYRFIKMVCDVGPQFEDKQEDVYNAYADFAAADGALTIYKKGEFTKDIKSKGYQTARSSHTDRDGIRPYIYRGFKLKESEFFELQQKQQTFDTDAILKGKKAGKKTIKSEKSTEVDSDKYMKDVDSYLDDLLEKDDPGDDIGSMDFID